jgi:hypothetical protein
MADNTEVEPEPMPAYPTAIVFFHVINKSVQLSTVIGSALVAPAVWWTRPQPRPDFLRVFSKTGLKSTGVGVALGSIMCAYQLYGEPQDAIEDRAFRLNHNLTQTRIDIFCSLTALTGMFCGKVLGMPTRTSVGLGLALTPLGILGTLFHKS